MNIVVLVSSYTPWLNSNTICIKRILDHFPEDVDIDVIANKNFSPHFDENQVINDTHSVIWVGSKRKKITHSLSIIKTLLSKGSYNNTVICDYLEYLFSIEKKIDIIVPVCFPFESCIAAMRYKEVFNNTIIAPILFDKYAESNSAHRFTLLKKLKFKHHKIIENKLLNISSTIFVTSSWHKYLLRTSNKILSKVIKIEHPLINDNFADGKPFTTNNSINKHISFFYAGALHYKVRTPDYCFDFFNKLSPKYDFTFTSYIVGPLLKPLISKYKYNENFIINGTTKKSEVDNQTLRADFLVVIGNNDTSQEQGKVYELMSTGMPIIYFYKSRHEPIFDKMNLYPHCFMINENTTFTASMLNDFNKFICEKINSRLTYESISSLFPEYTSTHVANNIFDELKKAYNYVFK